MSGEPFNVARLLYLLVVATLFAAALRHRPPAPAELNSDPLSQSVELEIPDEIAEANLDTEYCPISADTENPD